MVDIVDKATRSKMMSGIKSKNTKPELMTRTALHKLGYRYNLNTKVCGIKPDIVLVKYKVAIFVHGCYWHKHEGCKLAYSNREYSSYLIDKFQANKARDRKQEQLLHENSWRIAIIWECTTRNNEEFIKSIKDLNSWIKKSDLDFYETTYKA